MKKNTAITRNNQMQFRYKEKKGFITIIIPVFKDVSGLKDTLDSLKLQKYPSNKHEIIVANDGDDSKISKICKKYNIKEIRITPNLGSYNARNKALEVSKGEFIAFTDADVKVSKNWLKNGVKLLNKYDYVGGPVNFEEKKKLNNSEFYEQLHGFDTKYLFENDYFCVTANLFIKRKIMQTIGGFDNRLKSGGDNEFGNRVHFLSNFIQGFDNTISVIHPYRNYRNIIMKKKRVYKGINDLIDFFPDRYTQKFFASYFDLSIYVISPPVKYIKNLKLFFFLWWLKFVDLYYITKYVKNIPLFQKGSKIDRIINIIK